MADVLGVGEAFGVLLGNGMGDGSLAGQVKFGGGTAATSTSTIAFVEFLGSHPSVPSRLSGVDRSHTVRVTWLQ